MLVLLGCLLVGSSIHGVPAAPGDARPGGLTCDRSFVNPLGGAWSEPTNWLPAGVPLDTDVACVDLALLGPVTDAGRAGTLAIGVGNTVVVAPGLHPGVLWSNVYNDGTIQAAAGADLRVGSETGGSAFVNEGTLAVDAEVFDVRNDATPGGAPARLSGAIVGGGRLIFRGDAVVAGAMSLAGTGDLGGAPLEVRGSSTFESGATGRVVVANVQGDIPAGLVVDARLVNSEGPDVGSLGDPDDTGTPVTNRGTLLLYDGVELNAPFVNEGTIQTVSDGDEVGATSLTATGPAARFDNAGSLDIGPLGLALEVPTTLGGTITGGGTLLTRGDVVLRGEVRVGTWRIRGGDVVVEETAAGSAFVETGTLSGTIGSDLTLQPLCDGACPTVLVSAPGIVNRGVLRLEPSTSGGNLPAGLGFAPGATFTNLGVVDVAAPATLGSTDGPPAAVVNEGTLRFTGGDAVAYGPLRSSGRLQTDGDLVVGPGDIDLDGEVAIGGTLRATGTVTLQPGVIVAGAGGLSLDGTIRGTGTVDGDLMLVGGADVAAPGFSPGSLSVGGDLVIGPGDSTVIELGGPAAGVDHDVIGVLGRAQLAGALQVVTLDGYDPAPCARLRILTASAIDAGFDAIVGGDLPGGRAWRVEVLSTGVDLVADDATTPSCTVVAADSSAPPQTGPVSAAPGTVPAGPATASSGDGGEPPAASATSEPPVEDGPEAGSPFAESGRQAAGSDGHQRSSVPAGLAEADEVSWSIGSVAASLLLALLLLLYVLLPTEMVNSTISENYDEMTAWLDRLRAVTAGLRLERAPMMAKVTLAAVATAACGLFLDPETTFIDEATLALFIGLIVGSSVLMLVGAVPELMWHRAAGSTGVFSVFPASIALAALCVFASRAAGFEPGVVFGLLTGLRHVGLDARREAEGSTIAAVATLATGITAWLVWSFAVEPSAAAGDASLSTLVVDATLAVVVIGAIVGLVFSLVPLEFHTGQTILRWSRPAWATLMVVSLFLLVHVVADHSGTGIDASLRTVAIVVVTYTNCCFAFWWYWRRRVARRTPSPSAGATPA